jgi:hypothetical protein
VLPRSFNDAADADRFKQSVPVILNLQSADAELEAADRLRERLTYALNGGMQRRRQGVLAYTAKR